MKTISKKILPNFFNDILFNGKRFEIRKDEDDIQRGDIMCLKEWTGEAYTGREINVAVQYVFRADNYEKDYGLKPGYCVIGFSRWN